MGSAHLATFFALLARWFLQHLVLSLVPYKPLALALFQGFSRDRNARTFISRVSVAGFLSE